MKNKFLLLLSVLFTNFISAQSISVSSPNGGENWASCSVHNITWTQSGTSGFFNVEYSTNNGSSWASLATNYSGTSFSWTVPNVSTSQALIRVYDYNNNTITDVSNAVFTITAAVTVTSPNGGENWQGGTSHTITWTQGAGVSNYWTIRYSLDAGTTWTTIINNTNITTAGLAPLPAPLTLQRCRTNDNRKFCQPSMQQTFRPGNSLHRFAQTHVISQQKLTR